MYLLIHLYTYVYRERETDRQTDGESDRLRVSETNRPRKSVSYRKMAIKEVLLTWPFISIIDCMCVVG